MDLNNNTDDMNNDGDDNDDMLESDTEGGIFDAFKSFPGGDQEDDSDDQVNDQDDENDDSEVGEDPPAKPATLAKKTDAPELKIDEAEDFVNLGGDDKPDSAAQEKEFDDETTKLAEGMDKKAGVKFRELRAELKAFKLKPAEAKPVDVPVDVQEKLKDLELKAAEAEGLRQKVEELSNVSAQVKVENSQEYEVKVLKPAAEILSNAKKFADDNGVEFEVIQEIVREGDKKLQAELIKMHLADVSEIDKQDLYQMIYGFKSLTKVRADLLADASSKLTQIEAEQIKKQEELRLADHKAIQTIQSGMWDKYQKLVPGLADDEGAPTDVFNKLRNRSLAVDYSKAAGKDKAYATFAGVILPHVVEQLNNAMSMLREYTGKEAVELRRRPKLGGVSETVDTDEDEDFMTKMRKAKFK